MPQQEKIGRPEKQPDELKQRVVVGLASAGTPQATIARFLNIDENTLRKHYGPELAATKEMLDAAVKGTLYRKCIVDQDTTALIWWSKTQMGWRESKDPFDDLTPKVIDGEYVDITPRELARKVAHVLAKAKYGDYNQGGNDD